MRTTPQGGGGASGQFGVDLQVMDTAAGYVEHVGSVMVGEVNRLMANLQGLVGTNWSSPAATAFASAHEQWQAAQQGLTRALAEMAAGLKDTSKQYDQADQDSRDGVTNAVRGLTYR